MIHALAPYPAYQDSGIPWLGDIPAHWEMERAKWLFQKMSRPVRPDDDVVTCFRDGVVTLRTNRRVSGFTNALKEIGYQGVRKGDLVVHAMDAFAGAAGVSDSDGKCSPVYAVCQPRSDSSTYYYAHIVREMARSHWIAALATGVRERSTDFRFAGFAEQVVPIPPRKEQDCIVHFLDYVDRRIRRYIRAQRKLIGLLEEQKQAIIQRAVTRGLNPMVRLRSSGVEWLGEIPEHWEVRRSRYIYREVDERSADGDEVHLSMSQKLGLVPSSMIEEHRLMSESYAGAKICRAGDLVLNRLKAHLGVFALAPERGVVSPDYTVFRADGSVCARYYELVYRSPACRVELRKRAKGIVQGFWRLYTDDFYQIYVPVPPRNEQEAILAYLDDSLRTIHLAVERHSREIDLIREYRTRLIADVVTGKLDVREAAANLPDEAEECEEPGEAAEADEEEMMAEEGQEEEE